MLRLIILVDMGMWGWHEMRDHHEIMKIHEMKNPLDLRDLSRNQRT